MNCLIDGIEIGSYADATDAHEIAADEINGEHGKNSPTSESESCFSRGLGSPFFPRFYNARRRMLNDSFPRVYVCTPVADASSGFIDAHDSPFIRAVNKIANLSTSIRLAMAKRDYTECALTIRVIYVLTIDDRDLCSSGNGSRCVKIFQCTRGRLAMRRRSIRTFHAEVYNECIFFFYRVRLWTSGTGCGKFTWAAEMNVDEYASFFTVKDSWEN